MKRRKETKMGGNLVTLLGPKLEPGKKAPDFTLLDNSQSPKSLNDFRGKKILLNIVVSLDTSVCDMQTRKFNEAASGYGPDVVILTISMDLPAAQKRWCGAAGVDRVITLSDHKDAAFGTAYGLLIEEKRLLNRAVVVIDPSGIVRYIEVLADNSNQPDYEKALAALKNI